MPEKTSENDKDQNKNKIEENQAETSQGNSEESSDTPKKPSFFFRLFSAVFNAILLVSLLITITILVFSLDFLNLWTFRNDIPEALRKIWPLNSYYEFVKMHQLPDEERYQRMLYTEQIKYDKLMNDGNRKLEERAKALENSYRALMRTQNEQNKLDLENLRKKQEELALKQKTVEEELALKQKKFEEETAIRQKKLDDELADLEKRKAAIDQLTNRLASEAQNLELSLIRFMEKENRLDQVCAIAAQMEPKSLAKVFDEVADNKLIYDIMGGLQPSHSAKTLANMDPEKAARIMNIGNSPVELPKPGSARSYIPESLNNLINDTKKNQR